uniref:Translation initiation factor IF-2, chloroplastic n=1 Tax=Cumathamnion serrulatum TaxID=1206573 RepID=A0A7U1AQV6_9FLOR|nr:translation initiation factor IF-2 [Cumathamnion serrulatum]QQY85245.1 translation initiation factor IF-2 [Cumathamnion serrulatum]
MINMYWFYDYLKLDGIYKFISYYNIMMNLNYSDKVLHLRFPKLIGSYESINSTPKKLLESINNSIVDINSKQINSNLSNKFDKKYKNDSHSEKTLDIKKNRSKVGKKGRKSVNVEQEDLFINKNNTFSSDAESLLKSHKINKYKKKDKYNSDSIHNDYYASDIINNEKNEIVLNGPLSVQALSLKLEIPEAEIITYLFLKGISVTINNVLDISIAKDVAKSYKFNILDQELTKEVSLDISHDYIIKTENIKRSPIITIFGHVDHGKTTLLDAILNTNLVNKESGGITQSVNAYEIEWPYKSKPYKLVFLDTPGHEAFTAMRSRSAKITDIALLVIAADDGLKPQSIEAINYILKMKLSYIIVINKVDKNNTNLLKIKEELVEHNIVCEEWGGNAKVIEISALTGKNLDLLLSSICLISDDQCFTADPNKLGQGTILEANLDKKQGVIANVITQNGTLKVGDIVIAGNTYGKIKSLINYKGSNVKEAKPSSIIQILGFSVVPQSGILFKVVNNDKEAKKHINSFSKQFNSTLNQSLKLLNTRITTDNNKKIKQLNIILKTNTQGSLEAIIDSFLKIPQGKVQINIVSADLGNISSNNIELALATNALIVCFNINISSYINNLVKQNNLSLKVFNIIYDLIDYIESYMLSLIEPEYQRIFIGRAVVQTVFYINKKTVVGCLVNEGKLKKMSHINVYRANNIVHEGILTSLKRIKDDVDEVLSDNECGVMCTYDLWQKMDIIEAYDLNPKEKSL